MDTSTKRFGVNVPRRTSVRDVIASKLVRIQANVAATTRGKLCGFDMQEPYLHV